MIIPDRHEGHRGSPEVTSYYEAPRKSEAYPRLLRGSSVVRGLPEELEVKPRYILIEASVGPDAESKHSAAAVRPSAAPGAHGASRDGGLGERA